MVFILHRAIPVTSVAEWAPKDGNLFHRRYNPAIKNKRSDTPKGCWMHHAFGVSERKVLPVSARQRLAARRCKPMPRMEPMLCMGARAWNLCCAWAQESRASLKKVQSIVYWILLTISVSLSAFSPKSSSPPRPSATMLKHISPTVQMLFDASPSLLPKQVTSIPLTSCVQVLA